MFFIETKRVYNHLLNEINNGKDLFTFDYKELKHIKYYDKNKNLLEYDIKYIGEIGEVYEKIEGKYVYNAEITAEINKMN